jgi:hypothetical protein
MRLARPWVVGLSVLLGAMALPVLPAVAGQPHPPQSATPTRQFGAHLYRMNAHAENRVSSATTLPGPLGAHLTYYGGRVVSNMQVVQVIYGSGSYASFVTSTGAGSMAAFFQGVLNSPYIDWLNGDYNTNSPSGTKTNQTIGRGHFVGQYTITPSSANNGSTIDDTSISAELTAQITAGQLPAPTQDASGNNNTYYAIFFPNGKTITQGGSSSCVGGGFVAYHSTIPAGSNPEVYYGVHPDMQASSGCAGQGGASTAFGDQTAVASHELVETITDAEVGLATTTAPPLAWYDQTNGEIGDICNGMPGQTIGSDMVTYWVQTEWSNSQQACIVSAPSSAPAVTSANSASFHIGTLGTFNVTAAGVPKDTLSENGALPGSVTFTDNGNNTATLTGTPVAGEAKSYPIQITAHNGIGTGAVQNFTLTISRRATALVYSGAVVGTYSNPVTLRATLTDVATGTPIGSQNVHFTIGTQGLDVPTNSGAPIGVAAGPLTLKQAAARVALSASFAGDTTYAPVTTIVAAGMTIAKQAAVVTTPSTNPRQVAAGASGAAFTLHATVRELADGSPGNIAHIPSVTFRLGPIGAGAARFCRSTPAGPINKMVLNIATRIWTVSCTIPADTPINVYEVTVAVGLNGFYQGTTHDVLLVAAPAAAGAVCAGTLRGVSMPANTTAAFAFNAYRVGAATTGKLIYIVTTTNPATGATTQHIMISSIVTHLAIAALPKPFKATITATGSLDGRTGYAIVFSAQDTTGLLADADRLGVAVARPAGAPVLPARLVHALPVVIATGDIRVR